MSLLVLMLREAVAAARGAVLGHAGGGGSRARLAALLLLAAPLLLTLWRAARPARRNTLLYASTRRNLAIMRAAGGALRRYAPTPWMWNGHAQTVLGGALRRPPHGLAYTRVELPMEGGGAVCVDWAGAGGPTREGGAPVLLVLHGLVGGSAESYVQWLVAEAVARGWQAAVLNARGCGGQELRSGQSFSAAFTGDVRAVVGYIRGACARATPAAAGGWLPLTPHPPPLT